MSEPAALQWSIDNCTVQRALQVLGDRWSFVVLREVFNGIRRFADLRTRTAIPRQVLTDRLALLVAEGLLRRQPYQEAGQRVREEYRLTQKGLDLYPVLVALNAWGTRYYADPEGSPLEFRHRGRGDDECGAEVSVVLRCAHGHELDDDLTQVRPAPGPGARRR
ncbi:winged helix-turn-helix transcriptional regulator [Spongisporangium articulatum]|uniref:Winged helix-turn-helix transcriptional regulator n=1 Tax=Spongisporangium articulatum TaxID=3362603 RepID=A0ABW8AHZ1_9ACTN